MKKASAKFNKKTLIVLILSVVLLLIILSFLWIYHCSKVERQVLLDAISQEHLKFSLFSREDNNGNEHPSTLIVWSKTSYSTPLFGEQVYFDAAAISLQEVAYFIVENPSLKTIFGQRHAQIILCEIKTPYQDIPQEIKAASFSFRNKYYLVAIEGATLDKEFYSVNNKDFLSKMLNLGIDGLPGTQVLELFEF